MEKDGFLEIFHPVEKQLGCAALLRNFKHHEYPGLNTAIAELIDDEITPEVASETYHAPPFNIGRPIPCLSCKCVEEQDNPKEDQVVLLVRKKYLWKRKKKQIEMVLNRLINKPVLFPELVKAVEGKKPITRLPYAVVKMTDHLANNPDKYFKGLYHWYYGNAMGRVTIRNNRFLFYAGGKNLNELCMSLFNKPRNSDVVPVLTPQVSMSMAEPGFVYDIVANNSVGAIGVRQRDACSFLNYYEVDDGSFSFRNFSMVKNSEYPFVAMDNSQTEFCTIDANRTVKFWSPDDQSDCIEQMTLPTLSEKLTDRFAQVKYDREYSSQIVAIVDRKNVYIYDKRENLTEPSLHYSELNKQTELCDDISLIMPSVREKYWYLGTNHSCLLLDMRMGFAEKWIHMLSQSPSVGRVFEINTESQSPGEAVILSTQTTNEAVAIYRIENNPRITCSPVRLPSRLDTLDEAHTNGVLTDPHLQHKFNYSVIGLVPYKTKTRAGILSLVSTGDIFHQSVSPNAGAFDQNATKLSEAELQFLEDWEDEFRTQYGNQQRNLTYTRTANFSKIVDSFDERIEIPSWNSGTVSKKQHWKIPLNGLYMYKDLLAPHLLESYGVHDLLGELSDEGESEPITMSSSRVDNWLTGNYGESKDNIPPEIGNQTHVFGSEDTSTVDPTVELDIVVPPEFDAEKRYNPPKKRRKK